MTWQAAFAKLPNYGKDAMRCLYFDTESSDLSASWGRILCASFAINDGPVWTLRGDNYKGHSKVDDSKLVVAIREVLEDADIIVGWNSIRHDIPLIDARLSHPRLNERPVHVAEKYGKWHVDGMYYVPKLGGRSLNRAAEYYKCQNQKTPLDGEVWQEAAAGGKPALDQIVEHCEADVEVLREVMSFLWPRVKKLKFDLSEVYPFISEIPSRR